MALSDDDNIRDEASQASNNDDASQASNEVSQASRNDEASQASDEQTLHFYPTFFQDEAFQVPNESTLTVEEYAVQVPTLDVFSSDPAQAPPVPPQVHVTAPAATMTTPKPDKPTMGGLRDFGTHFDAWTGGKPNSAWTALAKVNPKMGNPNQLRSYNIRGRSAFNARRSGLYTDEPTRRFKPGGDLDYFCHCIRTGFFDNGMDTICYRKDPLTITSTGSGTVKMIDVLGTYHRLNRHALQQQSSWFQQKFDDYDTENDESAIRFFLNSLDPGL